MPNNANRSIFRHHIEVALDNCPDGQHFAVIVIKLVDLRKLNILRGYDRVDSLINSAFESLTSTLKKTSDTYGLGSSTFGLIVRDLKFPHLIQLGIERALESVRGPHLIDGEKATLEALAGVALYPQDGRSADQLFMHAESDTLSRESSSSSGFPKNLPFSVGFDRWQLESDLKSVVEKGELFLNYQPQISLKNGCTVGFESLIRWRHPVHGIVPPDIFLPLAESSGMMGVITDWLIQTGLREINQIQNADDKITISINISTPTLLDPGFPYLVDSAISLWSASYDQLIIEITESVLMKDFEAGIKVLSVLRSKGVGVSIDDFGTGYSSLSYFKRLPVDELKIDRLFVQNVVADGQDRKLIEAITNIAHIFNMKVVAEGVEDQATHDALREIGCNIAQGYYISKPLDATQMSSWCAGKRS